MKVKLENVEANVGPNMAMIISVLGKKWEDRGHSAFVKAKRMMVRDAYRQTSFGERWDSSVWEKPENQLVLVGDCMETEVAMLKKINDECSISAQTLKNAFNEVQATQDALNPAIKEMVDRIRATRMTVTTELKQALSVMKDVRKFFLESEYKEEMERLERFVQLGERMKALLEDGTMDAVSDIVIKLMDKGDTR